MKAVRRIGYIAAASLLYVATHGRGVYTYTFPAGK